MTSAFVLMTASVSSILIILSKDFVKVISIGFILSLPLAYYLIDGWLENFAYRIDLQPWVFALAGALAIGIAFLTVSFQSIKAALANPIKSLRNE